MISQGFYPSDILPFQVIKYLANSVINNSWHLFYVLPSWFRIRISLPDGVARRLEACSAPETNASLSLVEVIWGEVGN